MTKNSNSITKEYQIDEIIFNFENCESFEVDFNDIKKFIIRGSIGANKGTGCRGIIVLNKNADMRYRNMGYDPGLTKFQRILKYNDIVSIEKYQGESAKEFELEYDEDDRGENRNQKCHINSDGDLIIEIN